MLLKSQLYLLTNLPYGFSLPPGALFHNLPLCNSGKFFVPCFLYGFNRVGNNPKCFLGISALLQEPLVNFCRKNNLSTSFLAGLTFECCLLSVSVVVVGSSWFVKSCFSVPVVTFLRSDENLVSVFSAVPYAWSHTAKFLHASSSRQRFLRRKFALGFTRLHLQ